MIDIYRNALLGEKSNADKMVQSAVNAINQAGGSTPYSPYAAGTPTLGSRELAETTRNNSLENVYKNNSLKETTRNNDLQNKYNMGNLAETSRNNDLQQTYRMGSLAEDSRNNNLQNNYNMGNLANTSAYNNAQIATANSGNQLQYGAQVATNNFNNAKADVYSAISKGADLATVTANIKRNAAHYQAMGVSPLDLIDAAAAAYAPE